MNDDRNTNRQSFFSRVFAGSTEGEGTTFYSPEEVGTGTSGIGQHEGATAHGFTVERAAEVIKNLPPEVPRLSAVRIVRGTLEAAGIDIAELESSTRTRESRLNSEIDLSEGRIQQLKDETEEVIRNLPAEVPRLSAVRIVRGTLEAAGIDIAELESSTRARESRLNSEIDLSEGRIQQLKDETEEVIRNLEDEIRKAREARNFGVSEEERKIQAAETGLDNIDLVRDFFGLPQEDELPADTAGEETQIMEGVEEVEEDETQVLRRPGPLSDSEDYWETGDKKEP